MFVDAPKIAILDLDSGGTSQSKELFNVPAEEAATFYVIVENQSPIASQPKRELEVYLESGSNDNGAIVTINGVSLNNSTYIDSFDVGEPDTLILTIERGPTFYDYPDIQIGFEPTCGEGPREYIYASAYFVNPCSPVTLVAPNENWVINDDTTKLVVAMQDYDPENPFLVDATLQYRRLGTGQDWTDVPGLQLESGNFIPADTLAANDAEYAEGQIPKYFFIWTIPTTEGAYPDGDYEFWWIVSVKTPANVRHNKPDLIMWNKSTKNCHIIEFSCPNDVNVSKKVKEKEDHYGPLIRAMNIMYPEYKFVFVPIVIGALGTVPKELNLNIRMLGFSENVSKNIIRLS